MRLYIFQIISFFSVWHWNITLLRIHHFIWPLIRSVKACFCSEYQYAFDVFPPSLCPNPFSGVSKETVIHKEIVAVCVTLAQHCFWKSCCCCQECRSHYSHYQNVSLFITEREKKIKALLRVFWRIQWIEKVPAVAIEQGQYCFFIIQMFAENLNVKSVYVIHHSWYSS